MTVNDRVKRVVVAHTVDLAIRDAFNAWLDPNLVPLWWGPDGYRTRVDALDASVGGQFSFHMTAPSGDSCPMTGTYTRIDPPTTLEFDVHDHCVADVPADVERPTRSSRVEVKFEAIGDKTQISITQTGLPAAYQVLAETGWGDSLSRFARAASLQGQSNETAKEQYR